MKTELITHNTINPNISLYLNIQQIGGPMIVNKEHIREAAKNLASHVFGTNYPTKGMVGVNDNSGIIFIYMFEGVYYKKDAIPSDWEGYPVEFHPETGRPMAY